jgi:hypothetical protein
LAEQEKSYISRLTESGRPARTARHKGPASAQDLQANRDGAVTWGKLVNCYRNSGAIGFTQRRRGEEAKRHKEFTMLSTEFNIAVEVQIFTLITEFLRYIEQQSRFAGTFIHMGHAVMGKMHEARGIALARAVALRVAGREMVS